MKKTWLLVAPLLVAAGVQAYFNPIEGGTNEFVTTTWDVEAPWLFVGGNSSNNLMYVSSGGQVNNQIGVIGNTAAATNNRVYVSGANARWNSAEEIAVGNLGSDSTLALFDGGRAETLDAYVGKASSNNYLLAHGEGSEFVATNLRVGHTGSDNSLSVTEGARVTTDQASLGHWIGSDGNAAFARGTNTVWSNSGALNVGEYGSDNLLIITDAGTVRSAEVNVGAESLSANNTISLWGGGALLDAQTLNIGANGNQVRVRDGGTVAVTELNIQDGGAFNLNDGGTLRVGDDFNLVVSGVSFNEGGTLEVGGRLNGVSDAIEGRRAVVLSGEDAVWNATLEQFPPNPSARLSVGKNTAGNALVLRDGATATAFNVEVGGSAGASNNVLQILGPSVFERAAQWHVGDQGSDNAVLIADGGRLEAGDLYIGSQRGATGNVVTVSGAGSAASLSDEVFVGHQGSNNRMDVLDGAAVDAVSVTVGGQLGAADNTLRVSGAGSSVSALWTSIGGYEMGGGVRDALLIESGGRVENSEGAIGLVAGADHNSVLVTGDGSEWKNKDSLYLGGYRVGSSWVDGGTGNSLSVADGGLVLVGDVDSANLNQVGAEGSIVVGATSGAPKVAAANRSTVTAPTTILGLGAGERGSATARGAGTTWNSVSNITVGAGGSGNTFTVADGAVLKGSGREFYEYVTDATIGQDASAVGNQLIITGAGSSLESVDTVRVGGAGRDNRFAVLDGANATVLHTTIGDESAASGNEALISGADSSLYSLSGATVGRAGSDNQLMVATGATLRASKVVVGEEASANGNRFVVSGAGSSWQTSQGSLDVGQAGSSNQFIVADGGYVRSDDSSIGHEVGADNNKALVTGADSEWFAYALRVGRNGSGNTLTVENGARVRSSTTYLGSTNGADNAILISGMGSSLSANGLNVESSSSVIVTNGARLETGRSYLGRDQNSLGSDMVVSGSGSVWTNKEFLYIGQHGGGNSLTISDGARVDSEQGYVGYRYGAHDNSVLLTGADSVWAADGSITVGDYCSNNVFTVVDGARLESTRGYVGRTANGNQMLVTGADSVWTNSGSFNLGERGIANTMMIENGGRVYNREADIGYHGEGQSNTVYVSGAESLWNTAGDLGVGSRGSDNALVASDGGTVLVRDGVVMGVSSSASGNQIQLSGAASMDIGETLIVGVSGDSNRVVVAEDAELKVASVVLGQYQASEGNQIMVDNASLEIADQLQVGVWGAGNALNIANAGSVNASEVLLSGAENQIRVDGPSSSLIAGELSVGAGENSVGNALVISGGGRVESLGGTLGSDAMASSNTVMVSGAGSKWAATGDMLVQSFNSNIVYEVPRGGPYDLSVGEQGSENQLLIAEGGRVDSHTSYVGRGANSSNNVATVSGEGSTWENRGHLSVGYEGSGNRLVIQDGGWVSAKPGITVGHAAGADGNQIVVSGEGSVLDGSFAVVLASEPVSADLGVSGGNMGGGNGVLVTNEIVVPPTQILRTMIDELIVGRAGSENSVLIEDGAKVLSGVGVVGQETTASNNLVSVAGQGAEWRTASDVSVGGRVVQFLHGFPGLAQWTETTWVDGGRGNTMHVGEGGLVSVGRDLHNRNFSSVTVDPGARINVARDYYQDATSALRFGMTTNAAGAPLNALVSVGGTAEFEEGARIEYASNVGELLFDTVHTNKILEAEKLIVAGVENPDSIGLQKLDASGTLVDVLFWESDADIYGLVGRKHLADSAGFDVNSMMGAVSGEIDDMSLLGHAGANQMINLLNTMSGSQQAQQLSQLLEHGAPTYQHAAAMTEGLNEIRKRVSRAPAERVEEPEGAEGPYRKDQGPRAWVKPYASWSDYQPNDGFSGYDHNVYGTVLGVDLPLETALLGVAGGYGRSVLAQDDGDYSEAKTGYGAVYVNWGTEDWFSLGNLAFGRGRVTQQSGTQFGNGAEYDASTFAAYLGGGREMRLNQNFLLTPKASVLWTYYHQQGYEDGTGTLTREVAPYERNSFLSSLGVAAAFQKEYETMVVKPEARLYWLHEFNTDAENVDYQLVGGMGGQYHYTMPAPESDVIETGLGISALFHDELELVFDIDWRFGQDYSGYALSGRLMYEF